MAMHYSVGYGPLCENKLPADMMTAEPAAVTCRECMDLITAHVNRSIKLLSDPAPESATLTPSKLRVQCGDLEIVGDSGVPGQAIGGWRVRAFKDGKPFAFKRLVLTVDVKGVVTVDASFYPKGAEPSPNQYVCRKCDQWMKLGHDDQKKCVVCGSEFLHRIDDESDLKPTAESDPKPIITPKQ